MCQDMAYLSTSCVPKEEHTSLVPGVGGLVSAPGQDLGAVILLRLLLPQHLDPAVPPAGVSRGRRGGQGQGQGQDENASPGGGGRPHLLASAAGDGVIHPGSESGACTKGGRSFPSPGFFFTGGWRSERRVKSFSPARLRPRKTRRVCLTTDLAPCRGPVCANLAPSRPV